MKAFAIENPEQPASLMTLPKPEVAIGPEMTDFAVGEEVFGFVPSMPPLENGTYAESISSADLVLVRKPTGLDFHEAAALPLAGSAALIFWTRSTLKMATPCSLSGRVS